MAAIGQTHTALSFALGIHCAWEQICLLGGLVAAAKACCFIVKKSDIYQNVSNISPKRKPQVVPTLCSLQAVHQFFFKVLFWQQVIVGRI